MSAYTDIPAAISAIELIAKGQTETRACQTSRITVARFRKTVAESEELRDMLTNAEALQLDALRDALLEIDASDLGSSDARMAAVKAKNLQWFLERADRKRYGQKTEVEVSITADKHIIEALARARLRVENEMLLPPPVLDGVFEELDANDAALAEILS